MSKTELARLDELTEGELLVTDHCGEKIGVCLVDGEVRAVKNICPHQFGPLARGTVDVSKGVVICPWHGREYDLATGTQEITGRSAPVLDVVVEDDVVYLASD